MSVRNTLTRNTLFNAAGRLWEAAVGLVLTAYVLDRIGLTAWGLWAFVSVFTGYMSLLDLGMGSGFARYIAQHAARRDARAAAAVVSTGFYFYIALGVLLVSVGWPCVDFVVTLLTRLGPERARDFGNPEFSADVRFLLRWGLVVFAVSNCVSPFTAVQTGLQRMGITNGIGFGASLVKIAATVAFVQAGYGVRALLYANACVLAVFGAASVAAAFWLLPGLRVTPGRVRRATFRELFGFGWRAQVARLADLITFRTDTIIVAVVYKFLGMVGLYELGLALANKMRQMPLLLLSALLPAAADLDAREEHERLRRLYVRSTKYVAAVTLPLVLFTMGAAGPLMRAWMGEKRDLVLAEWVLRIMAFGYLGNILAGAGVSIVMGKGRSDLQMKAGLIAMVSNIVLTILLVYTVGFYGIALGTALSLFISCAWFWRAVQPVLGVGPGELLRASALWPVLAALPGFAVCACGDWATRLVTARLPNGMMALGGAVVFGVLYALVLRWTPFLDAFDRDFLERTLGLGRVPGFRWWARRAPRV